MNEIKNCVKLSIENGTDLVSRCKHVIETTKPEKVESVRKFSFSSFKYIEVKHFSYPFWWQYKESLLKYFVVLMKMLNRGDPVFISLLAYENLIKLSEGDRSANPIYIMNY